MQGTDATFLEKLKRLEKIKDDRLWAADSWKKYQEKIIHQAHDCEVQQANEEFLLDKKGLTTRLIQSVEDRQKLLEEQKNSMDLSMNPLELTQSLRPNKRRFKDIDKPTRRKINPPHINYMLRESEIYEDLHAIQKKPPSSIDRTKLYELLADIINTTEKH